ncbi:MAG: FtsW/RodA/SpoVE family cell cycle protein, partial [Armatimonadetes bacterium]|nr:FtsW/RodA/SpoVE family cell cycle protein [Candidatus Hippobium faecium]
SELAKYTLVLGMALLLELTDYFAYKDWLKHRRNLIYIFGIVIMLGFCFVCAAKESMSMGIVYTVIIASMLFFGNIGRTAIGKVLIVLGVLFLLLAFPMVNIMASKEKHDYGVADKNIIAENEIKYAEDTESLLGSDRDRITEFECNNFFGKHKNDDLTDEEKRTVVSLMNYYEANYSYLTALDKLREESRISNYEKLIDDAKNGKNFGKYIKAGSGENNFQIDYEKCFSDYGSADYKGDIAKAENCSRLNDYEKFLLKNYFLTTVDYQKAVLVKNLEDAREKAEYASMSKFGRIWAKAGKGFRKRFGKKEEQRYVDYLYSRYSDFAFTRPYGEGNGSVLDKKIFQPEKIYTSFESGKNFRNRRLLAWKEPFRYRESEGQQPAYASLAVARGGFFGKFLGRGICKTFMAESDNDYIFSTIAEETGFVGCTVVLFFFCMFFWSCLCIAHSCKSNYGKMVVAGSFVALCT